MSEYSPDKFVVVEFKTPTETILKVIGSWYGGYTGSDSWRMNSGIESVSKVGKVYYFNGYSGSVYECHEDAYGMSLYTSGVYSGWEKTAKYPIRILSEDEVKVLVKE